MRSYSTEYLAQYLGATLHGDASVEITGVATLKNAQSHHISFLSNRKYHKQLSESQAGVVLIREEDLSACPNAALVMRDPYVGFAKVAQLLDTTPEVAIGIDPSAVIAEGVTLGNNVSLGANCVVGEGAVLADDVAIGPGCVVGPSVCIGEGSKLWANVTLYHGVSLGKQCIIHSGAVIGADGFGYANEKGAWVKIPQLGSVSLGDRVEIGASTTIDRGALDDTQIHDGVIIDNQCQIGHNTIIGANTAIAGGTVIAGSTSIGKQCIIAGACAIAGHLEISDGVQVSGMTMVIKSIKEPGVFSSGSPAMPHREWQKNMARVRHLDSMNKRLKQLEKNENK